MNSDAAAANPSYGTTASGSSFYAAMRILPREQREAMFQIYSFCRQVEDVADSDALLLAFHLGRALQLTNILRDLDEDAAIGRLYLPREALVEAGIMSTDPVKVISNPAVAKACALLVVRARTHFENADEVMRRNPRRVVRAPRIMSKYYRAILER